MGRLRYHDPDLRTARQLAPPFTVRLEGEAHEPLLSGLTPFAKVCALTLTLIDRLPSFEQDDPFFMRVIGAVACELMRFVALADQIRLKILPQNADDDNGPLLTIWEHTLGLPVNPAGVAVEDRQALVLAHFRAASAASGIAWFQAMNKVMPNLWGYQEGPEPYRIWLFVPFDPSTSASVRAEKFARTITPAHLEIAVEYAEGFIVGVSLVGEDRL